MGASGEGGRGGGHTREEQILRALHQAERRHPGERHLSRAWDQRADLLHLEEELHGTGGLTELRELRQLCEENGKLKRLVADLSLDRYMLPCCRSRPKKGVGLAIGASRRAGRKPPWW